MDKAQRLIAWLSALKSNETKAIRIYRTGLKQPQKSAMLRKHAELYGEPPLKWDRLKKQIDYRQH